MVDRIFRQNWLEKLNMRIKIILFFFSSIQFDYLFIQVLFCFQILHSKIPWTTEMFFLVILMYNYYQRQTENVTTSESSIKIFIWSLKVR